MSTHRASAFLVLKATRCRYGVPDPDTGLRPVDTLRVVAMRQSRPRTLDPDEIAVKISVEVPDAVFDPISPVALVVVPSDLAMRGPIEAEVENSNPGDGE